jgi:hypothetical protein
MLQLGKNSVKAKQIAKGAVGTSEVKDRALKAVDFAKGQLPQGALKNLVVREFSTTVPGTCTSTGASLPTSRRSSPAPEPAECHGLMRAR